MVANVTHDQPVEEDYIDLNNILSSSTNFLCRSSNKSSSPTHSNEFEFQKNGDFTEKFPTTSPADDLFCNGRLLPLHLPPPPQPSPKAHDSITSTSKSLLLTSFHLPSTAGAAAPFDSGSISPSTSCYASQELNPEDYFDKSQSSKPLSMKIKLLRHPSFSEKLKASTAYLKSLFALSTCSNDSFAAPKAKEYSPFAQRKPTRRSPFGLTRSFRGDKKDEAFEKRMSFSDHTVNKFYSSSSSSSTSSSSSCSSIKPIEAKFLSSEVENLIQGAIAYCKKSHQSVSYDGMYSFSASGVTEVCEKQGNSINLPRLEAELFEGGN
ncbi:putative membrane-associated kinase regulator 4 [Platanthera zijinensis]|uniref:Membrane-associated kinase regulator 4 n=1 Tax=Platanthera zijinensis TaxID=2320716 RepID=A0AAP0B2K3_9ASPA